jgi:hypothetical protein
MGRKDRMGICVKVLDISLSRYRYAATAEQFLALVPLTNDLCFLKSRAIKIM